MLLDTVVRLIDAASSSDFREVAMAYLAAAGYESVELTDGSGDGGSDITLWQLGINPEPVAVQVTVQQKGWQSKLRHDAQRARDVLKRDQFVYITSRRVAQSESTPLLEDLYAKQSISARIVDGQAVASRFHNDGAVTKLLEILGIQSSSRARGSRQADLREDLAYSYAFFGTDVTTFRERGFERSIAAYVAGCKEAPTREDVEVGVTKALKLHKSRAPLVARRFDAMAQRGELLIDDGRVSLDERLADDYRAARAVRERQQDDVRKAIARQLGDAGLNGAKLEKAEELFLDAAGTLMLSAGNTAGAEVVPNADMGPARQRMLSQLRRLERGLVNLKLDRGDAASLVTHIARTVAESELGQTLLAGELFLSLLDMDQDSLMRALGGAEDIEVFLDASVAIPILASLLYEPHSEHFFRAAHAAYERATTHGIKVTLPRDYLEEAASHLLFAWDNYRPLLESNADLDLAYSRNAYVAHYLGLVREGKYDGDFKRYLEAFGFRETSGSERSFTEERNWVMSRMQTELSRYGISVANPGVVPHEARKAAEGAIAYTARELRLERSNRLLVHDARAVADISSRAAVGSHTVIFCTWDRLHLRLRTAGGPIEWNAMDPVVLTDLLSLAATDEESELISATEVALEFRDSEARYGGEIWDALVRIERENLHDAELIRRAREFKDAFLETARDAGNTAGLAAAWEEWKTSDRNPG